MLSWTSFVAIPSLVAISPLKWASHKVVLQFTVNVSLLDHPNDGSAFEDEDDRDDKYRKKGKTSNQNDKKMSRLKMNGLKLSK